MNKFNFAIKLAALTGTLAISATSWAGCTVGGPVTLTAGGVPTTLSISGSLAVGSPIGSLIAVPRSTPNSSGISCTGSTHYDALVNLNSNWTPSSIPGVYQTSIPGVGMKISLSHLVGSVPVLKPDVQFWYREMQKNVVNGYSYMGDLSVQFYVTGPVTPGIYDPEIMAESWFNNAGLLTTAGAGKIVTYMLPKITVKSLSCETPDIKVNLGKFFTGDFSTINSTSTAKPFNFEIKHCTSDTNSVSYTFKPAAGITLQQAGTSNQYLTLSGDSSATGVGVQVLYDTGEIVPFNSKINYTGYTAGVGGSYVIPMKARYIKTASTIGGGKANSALEFTMTYE